MRVLLPLRVKAKSSRKRVSFSEHLESQDGCGENSPVTLASGEVGTWVEIPDDLRAATAASLQSLQFDAVSGVSALPFGAPVISTGLLPEDDQKPPTHRFKTTGLLPPTSSNARKRPLDQRKPPAAPSASFSLLDQKPKAQELGSLTAPKKTKMVAGNSANARFRLTTTNNLGHHDDTLETVSTNPALWGDNLETDDATNSTRSSRTAASTTPTSAEQEEFALLLKKRGLEIQEQEGDGNCLFRAISLQVYGDAAMHGDIRRKCMDFMERDKKHFSQFVTGEPFEQYVQRKKQEGVHGNHAEIQAISELFNRPVEVFCPDNGADPLNIFHAEYKTDDAPIRLSYHDGNHYNAVIDPLVPTAGLGLGLPGLQPGLADKLQMAKAVAESDAAADQADLQRAVKASKNEIQETEDDELQRAIKESQLSAEHMHSHEAMALSDMDATYFELEQAALEKSMESFPQNEHGQKQKASSSVKRKEMSRSFQSDMDDPVVTVTAGASTGQSAVVSLPSISSSVAASIPQVAAVASAASAASSASTDDTSSPPVRNVDEYPQSVQELVMNGFDLAKVVRAYELIGDNFDNLLTLLMSNSSR